MAYGNYNNGDTKNISAVWVSKPAKDGGKPSKYYSFTFEIGGYMYTARVYGESTYTPKSGKHAGKKCCPVRLTRWEKSSSNNMNW